MIFDELFIYNPDTGIVTWTHSDKVSKRVRGKQVGSPHNQGYIQTNIKGKSYLLHRLIWEMVYGSLPPIIYEIDHINGDRSDNRLENLRVVTRQQNLQNSKGKVHSSRFKGVSWDKVRNQWVVYIKEGNKVKNLGRFSDEEEAAERYRSYSEKLYGDYAKAFIHPALTPEAVMVHHA